MMPLNFNPRLAALTISLTLGFGVGAGAQGISKEAYKMGQEKIESDYVSAKVECDAMTANPHDICIARAKGAERVARAELEANYKPSAKTRNQIRVTRAKSDYTVAREQCDELAGNAKDVCIKEAKARQVAALADAKVALTTSDANATATKKSTEAYGKASTEVTEARKDAAIEKLEAQYKVEKEKCNQFAGDTKEQCLSTAKATFGKP